MIMPMNTAKAGETIRVKKILMDEEKIKRFMEIGLVSSNEIKVVQNNGSSLILSVAGSRLGLDSTAARRIMVEQCV